MYNRVRKQIDHQDAGDDEGHADHGRDVECLFKPDPADCGDKDDAEPAPDRVGDAD